jgi:hypothetical protein
MELVKVKSWDRSVVIETGYMMDIWRSVSCRTRHFALLPSVHISPMAHPASLEMLTIGSFPGGKVAEA